MQSVWYEWCVNVKGSKLGERFSEIHNAGGRGYSLGK